MKNIKDYNLDELQEELINMGEKKFRADSVVPHYCIDRL